MQHLKGGSSMTPTATVATLLVAVMMASVEVLNACVPPVCYPPTGEVPTYTFGGTDNLLVIFSIIIGAVACLIVLISLIMVVWCYCYRHKAHMKKEPPREKKPDLKLVYLPVKPQPNVVVVQDPEPIRPPILSFPAFANHSNPRVPVIKARLDSPLTFAINSAR